MARSSALSLTILALLAVVALASRKCCKLKTQRTLRFFCRAPKNRWDFSATFFCDFLAIFSAISVVKPSIWHLKGLSDLEDGATIFWDCGFLARQDCDPDCLVQTPLRAGPLKWKKIAAKWILATKMGKQPFLTDCWANFPPFFPRFPGGPKSILQPFFSHFRVQARNPNNLFRRFLGKNLARQKITSKDKNSLVRLFSCLFYRGFSRIFKINAHSSTPTPVFLTSPEETQTTPDSVFPRERRNSDHGLFLGRENSDQGLECFWGMGFFEDL